MPCKYCLSDGKCIRDGCSTCCVCERTIEKPDTFESHKSKRNRYEREIVAGDRIILTGCHAVCTKCHELYPLAQMGLRYISAQKAIRNQPQCESCRGENRTKKRGG